MNKAIKIIEAVKLLISLNIGGISLNVPCTYADFMRIKKYLMDIKQSALKCEHVYIKDVGFLKVSKEY